MTEAGTEALGSETATKAFANVDEMKPRPMP